MQLRRVVGPAFVAIAAASFPAGSTNMAAQAEPRAVLELFTSQGCSSCPPADKLAGTLAGDPSLLVISVPIDYWDYLGWRDTLALPQNSARQRAYAKARGDRQIYTPQMVINGASHALGSDQNAIEKAIAITRQQTGVMALPVTVAVNSGRIEVAVPAGDDGRGAAEVWLCTIKHSVPVEISRGENRGRTVVYHNVAKHWIRLGEWDGKAHHWSVPLAEIKKADVDEAAVIVQPGAPDRPGPIYGAAFTELQ